jgi:hypothetical protein
VQDNERTSQSALPWRVPPLDEWSIVGMNHFHVDGMRLLFVAMTRDGKCIKVEGLDTPQLWQELRNAVR